MDSSTGKRFAAIDIGSNAVRLLIVSARIIGKDVKVRELTLIRIPIRLGADVFTIGEIGQKKKKEMIFALRGFSSIMKAYGVADYKAVATSAMRDAKNGQILLYEIEEFSGIDIEIINGQIEAKYIFDAGLRDLVKKSQNYVHIDVGGGSTEITLFIDGKNKASASFQLGTVRILENGLDEDELNKLSTWLDQNVGNKVLDRGIGTGGNINSYYKITGSKKGSMSTAALEKQYKKLVKLDYEARMNKYNLKFDRADVIVPAGFIYLHILNHLNVKEILVPKLGLADGLVNAMISLNAAEYNVKT